MQYKEKHLYLYQQYSKVVNLCHIEELLKNNTSKYENNIINWLMLLSFGEFAQIKPVAKGVTYNSTINEKDALAINPLEEKLSTFEKFTAK